MVRNRCTRIYRNRDSALLLWPEPRRNDSTKSTGWSTGSDMTSKMIGASGNAAIFLPRPYQADNGTLATVRPTHLTMDTCFLEHIVLPDISL